METPKDFSWHKAAEYNLFEENYQQFGIWYLHFSRHENVGKPYFVCRKMWRAIGTDERA